MGRMIQLSHHSSACLAYFHREHSDNQRAGEARPHLFQQKHRCLRLVSHHLSIILCSPLWYLVFFKFGERKSYSRILLTGANV